MATTKTRSSSEYQNHENKFKLNLSRVLVYIFMIIIALLCLLPFYMMIINATRTHVEIQTGVSFIPSTNFLSNLKTAWEDTALISIPQGLLNSFIIAAACSVLSTYFAALTAYAIHVYDFKGRNFAFKFIMMVMMIPTQVSALGFYQILFSMGLTDTYWGLIVPAVASPATFFYMKQYIATTLPLEVVEAARVDGSNEFKTFNVISLPILKPALAVQLIFTFVASWNNYFTPALLISKKERMTIPIMLGLLRSKINSENGDLGEVYMFILLSIIPVVIVYVCLSKFIIKGVTLGSVKG